MKVERGLPILEGVELDKYKSLAKTVVSNGSNIESKITPLRKKTDDEEAQAVCAAFDEWLGDAKDMVQAQIQSNPLEAVTAITRLKTAPQQEDFRPEQRKAKGRKVSESDLKSPDAGRGQSAESDNEATQTVAGNLKRAFLPWLCQRLRKINKPFSRTAFHPEQTGVYGRLFFFSGSFFLLPG